MPRKPVDLTLEILKDIRDAVRETNVRLDTVRTEVSARLDTVRTELSARLDQTNTRLDAVEHTLSDMAGQFTFLTRYVKHSVRQHGARIDRLEGRVEKLEQRGADVPR
ncbi:MAG TPA: hypothetical protein VGQ83_18510 [Polyangia bacterium]|jgi:hypothetical protein